MPPYTFRYRIAIQVQKLMIVVELLMGDIPDRALFRNPTMRKTLQPYFQLTQGEHPRVVMLLCIVL